MSEENKINQSYIQKLQTSANETGSIVCMGLDPVMGAIPGNNGKTFKKAVTDFYEKIFDRMEEKKVYPGMFKPNHGFFEIYDDPGHGEFHGSETLSEVIFILEERFPKIIRNLDFKRGDIGKSSANYAEVGKKWNVHALTVHPYMGTDSVMPFINIALGIYILDRTSNSGGADFQNLKVISDEKVYAQLENILSQAEKNGRLNNFAQLLTTEIRPMMRRETKPLYMMVAEKIVEWGRETQNVGAVIGATNLNELYDISKFLSPHQTPLLIPGVGGQGGTAEEVLFKLNMANYNMGVVRINNSSKLTHPWDTADKAPADWDDVVVQTLKKMNNTIGYVPK